MKSAGSAVAHVPHFITLKNLDQSVYDRYRNETYRLWVLEKQLESHEWIACDKFTITGAGTYPLSHKTEVC